MRFLSEGRILGRNGFRKTAVGLLFLVAEPPFQVVFVASFLLFVGGLFGAKHLLSSFQEVLLGEG
jgi:hypothetical protein